MCGLRIKRWYPLRYQNLDVNMISYVKTMNSGEATNALTQLHMSANDWAWNNTVYTVRFPPSKPCTLSSDMMEIKCTDPIHALRAPIKHASPMDYASAALHPHHPVTHPIVDLFISQRTHLFFSVVGRLQLPAKQQRRMLVVS